MIEENIYITYPVEGEQNKFICKTLEEATGEDFVAWVQFVYPGGLLNDDPTQFDKLIDRKTIFEAICLFWTTWHNVGVDPSEAIKNKLKKK